MRLWEPPLMMFESFQAVKFIHLYKVIGLIASKEHMINYY